MANYSVKLEGVEDLLKNLNKIDNEIRQDVALKAVTDGAIQIKNRAVNNAPVKTGNLRNSAIVESRNEGGKAVAEIVFRREYARIQEFGGTAGRHHSVTIKGKHYLENAINQEKVAAVNAMANVIKDHLDKQK